VVNIGCAWKFADPVEGTDETQMTCREVGEIVGRASTCSPTVRHYIAHAVEA
jgi:hypothetical protein